MATVPLSPPKGRLFDFVAAGSGSGWGSSRQGGSRPLAESYQTKAPGWEPAGLVDPRLYCFAESMTLGVPGVIPTTLAPEAGEVRRLWLEGLGRFPPKCEHILRLRGL